MADVSSEVETEDISLESYYATFSTPDNSICADAEIIVFRIYFESGQVAAVALLVLDCDTFEVLFQGTVQPEWRLYEFEQFAECRVVVHDANGDEHSFWLEFDDADASSLFSDMFRTARELVQRRRLTGRPLYSMLSLKLPSVPLPPSNHAVRAPSPPVAVAPSASVMGMLRVYLRFLLLKIAEIASAPRRFLPNGHSHPSNLYLLCVCPHTFSNKQGPPEAVTGPIAKSSSTKGSIIADGPPDNFEDYLPPRVTRRASLGAPKPMTAPASHPSFATTVRIEDLDRKEYHCSPTDIEKATKTEPVSFWVIQMDGRQELTEPPTTLSKRPDLQPEDIFCHRVPGRRDPQVWIWQKSNDGRFLWKPVMRGHVRAVDKRVLFFSCNPKRPSYITKEWYRKLVRLEGRKENEASSRKREGA
ncbi:hypothetical protein C8Q76DRAFT_695457 [Earliella scabrosa]|nr:hypothetical protein C8Q76DRAFT_695457 [Earliella scabrosa]